MQRGTSFKKALQKADRRLYLEMVEEAFQDWLRWKNKQEREHNAMMEEQERSLKALKEQEKRLREDVARVNREMWLKKKAEEKKRRVLQETFRESMNTLKSHQLYKVSFDQKVKGEEGEDAKKQKLKQAIELQKKEREIMCKKSVEKWMKEARYKPKPTRSNLGLASLVCTNVGKMNPIPWKDIVEKDGTD